MDGGSAEAASCIILVVKWLSRIMVSSSRLQLCMFSNHTLGYLQKRLFG